MTPEEQKTAEAIKELRTHLGESQQEFSNRLGVVVRTVARYELEKPPRTDALLNLAAVAEAAGRNDLATVFRRARARFFWTRVENVNREAGAVTFDVITAVMVLSQLGDRTCYERLRECLRSEAFRLARSQEPSIGDEERKLFHKLCEDLEQEP